MDYPTFSCLPFIHERSFVIVMVYAGCIIQTGSINTQCNISPCRHDKCSTGGTRRCCIHAMLMMCNIKRPLHIYDSWAPLMWPPWIIYSVYMLKTYVELFCACAYLSLFTSFYPSIHASWWPYGVYTLPIIGMNTNEAAEHHPRCIWCIRRL